MSEARWHWFIDQIDPTELHGYAVEAPLYFGRTRFQQVEIVRHPKFGKLLILDGKIQSAGLDEHLYHEALVHPALTLHPEPRRVLIIGGGEGATLREVLKHRAVREAVMVDLDEEVVKLSRTYLPEWSCGAFNDPRTRLVFQDGRRFICEGADNFDVILLDITDPVTTDFGPTFYGNLRGRLAESGIVAMQALELNLGDSQGHRKVRDHLGTTFSQLISYRTYIPSFRAEWGFLLASADAQLEVPAEAIIRERLEARLPNEAPLRFYSPEIHRQMFSLPTELAAAIGQAPGVGESSPASLTRSAS
ncbi:MAG: spermidine synthase [Candidatus Methylomirabilales bacterium]